MAKTKADDRKLKVVQEEGVSDERQLAKVALNPLAGAAAIASCFSKGVFGPADLSETFLALSDRARDVRGNKLTSVEDMLTAHAATLNAIFLELAQRSQLNLGEYINAAERYMRLALKAQSQCRATLETLAAIKNPPIIYARQANIAAGHQQVNNCVDAPAREKNSKVLPNELLEAPNETIQRLDAGTTGSTVGGDPPLEPVAALHRSPDARGENPVKPQRVQRRQADEGPR